MKLKKVIDFLLVLLLLNFACYASDVVLIDVSNKQSVAMRQLDLACQFLGLKVGHITVGNGKDIHHILDFIKRNNIQAIVITEKVLEKVESHYLLAALQEIERGRITILIMGLTPRTNSSLLRKWSGGAIAGSTRSKISPFNGFYVISDLKVLTQQLSGQQIPFSAANVNYLDLDKNDSVKMVTYYKNDNDKDKLPFFVKVTIASLEMFFLTDIPTSVGEGIRCSERPYFFEIAPLIMFLRYCCDQRCWHGSGYYANFTIDDPWLTEPYGHLSYIKLLEEMEKANFHTTIAFIPWNYDRSKQEVESLFRDNPDRFSICIHGNNHDHREFYRYEKKTDFAWSGKNLAMQEANIKQALTRMARFRNLTGISYDKVMVFPHGIAPAKTLGLLKKYNFLATVNAGNVPLGKLKPEDVLFGLKPVTLEFENFPSLNRYTPKSAQSDIAIDLFLDNPLLFYSHHDFFEDGINAFNETAIMVNNMQSDIIWQSLGYIIQHFYLEKLRDDNKYDVLAFSSNFIIENNHQRDLTYFIRKEESFSFPIKKVTVDGYAYSYKKSGSYLSLEVCVPKKESRHIVIEYENDLDISSIDVSKNDPRINRLRRLSDFRDMILSKYAVGRAFTRVYYDTGIYKLGLVRLAIVSLVLVTLMTLIIRYFIKRKKKQKITNFNIKSL